MHKENRRKNEGNTFGGWAGTFPPTSPLKRRIWGGGLGGVAGGGRKKPLGLGLEEGEREGGGGGGRRGPGRSACRATPPGATGVYVTSLRGGPLLTAASVAGLSRPNGLTV